MALQKQKEDVSGELTEPFAQDSKTKMVEEEEEALVEVELEALGSESSFQTETPDLLGDGGHPTPEDEDDRPFFFEKNLEQLDTSHTVMCTFSISLAVPMAAGPKHRTFNLTDKQRKKSNIGKDAAAIPKMRRYYHIEYFLLPDDVEPRKLDLVLFGVVAKLFAECESKPSTAQVQAEHYRQKRSTTIISSVVKPWFENDQIWVSWNHSINIHVTNEFLIKLRDHKVTLTIWDTKDKVSAKARFSKPRVPFSQVEDSDAIGGVKYTVLLQRKLFEDNQPELSCVKMKGVKVPSAPEKPAMGFAAGESKPLPEEDELYETPASLSVFQSLPPPSRTDDFPSVSPFSVSGSILSNRDKILNEGNYLKQNTIAGFSDYVIPKKPEKTKFSLENPADHPGKKDPKGKRKSSTPKRGPALKERRQSKVSNAETLIAALTKKCGIASFQLDLMPLLSGERLVISRLQEKSSKILDAYMTFTTEEPLMSERQISELNPLIIKILSATCLPMTPVPIEVLQATCVPAYCRYQFHNLPPHQTQGQTHGTHIYFKDVNVILTGTISPGELREYFRGPPLEIEVHDRDRKMAEDIKTPSLFGEDQDDGKLSNVGFVSYKHTAYNPFTEKDNLWHPYGVAKVSLTDLLLGKKYLNISVPIHSCSVPYPGDQKDSKTEKIMGVLGSVAGPQSSPLPVGHYLESDSVLKVRVEIAVPLGLQAETADTEVANCPYGCIIYIFDYNNAPCLHDLLQEITEINAEALQLDSYPLQVIQMALATFKLKTTTKEISELDIITGFHILDGIIHLLVLEGLKDKAIKRLWEQQFDKTHRTENGRLDILYNSQLSFHQRLYTDLEAILYHIHLCKPLSAITRQPLLYVRDMVRQACFQALSRLDYLCHSKKLRDVVQRGLLPSAEMITVLSQEFGIPLTKEDLFIQRPPLPSVSSLALQKSRKVPTKQGPMHSLLDNHNEKYIQCKKEMEDKMQHYKDHIQTNIDAVYLLSRKVKKPKFRAIRSSPADGKSVYNYSSQHLNSAERAKMQLRKELAKKPGRRFAYCHEYLSAMFDPVDLDTVRKESIAKSKNLWVSPSRFVYPGFKSYIESNLHPRMPDKTRLKELTEKWQENILFANILEPVLSRDRWSWDQRHIDFDLYKKPPVYLPASAPATHRAVDTWLHEDSGQLQKTVFDDTKLKVYRCSTAAELTTRGPKASAQLDKLQGLLKDEPEKFSLKRPAMILRPIPALSVLQHIPACGSYPDLTRKRSTTNGFVPGLEDQHSLKWNGNIVPCHDMEHRKFEKLKGADFNLLCYEHSFLYKPKRPEKKGEDTTLLLQQDSTQ
ncbi:uncharacterized protein CFAP92 [Chelonoidis abingdonii]|uniref:uncharacterized protein CFAP92 n=1 Tax=Chelonoidis abingdonii TaxID=106734 RepID=UPI0013F18AD9|nr:uncharacterized protein KIAA1257 homolog [Chelonoidis abingdonii]XP_032661483.1 uncharacterized protein KIAA1257 homolog [Chelonoidis abingdonii]XP_032661492.1 uncharacterized protein KIAA1257 homolog [Chelonoidis abingdonii]XP_032661502.1 uncharacterized protein KIAA1257 homolog [Chelonoidis abingdonii]XP_032661509.1 uncharacterized protein KIAA1257 homolog [Chelonoidis abingdonii]XP_032661519.1 uncharacterized protein KIAA1257 homolog [Chelonoidis abingdonii]XP_032661528.1 uncharacterize